MMLRSAQLFGYSSAVFVLAIGFSVAAWAEAAAPIVATNGGDVINSAVAADHLKQCLSDLRAAKVEFVELGSISKEGCTVEGAIQLGAISSPFGNVSIPGRPIMVCTFARQFTTWVRDVAAPLTVAYLGSKLAAIETGPGLVCRTRYDKPGEKMSEHAKGDAIDIMAFRAEDGRRLSVKDASASA
jgi:hypothetical protein